MLKAIGYAVNDTKENNESMDPDLAEHMAPAAFFHEPGLPLNWVTCIYPKAEDPDAHIQQLKNLIARYHEPLLVVGGGNSVASIIAEGLDTPSAFLCWTRAQQTLTKRHQAVMLGDNWRTFNIAAWAEQQSHWVLWVDVQFLEQQLETECLALLMESIQLNPCVFLISGYDPYQDHHRQLHEKICQMIKVFSQVASSS